MAIYCEEHFEEELKGLEEFKNGEYEAALEKVMLVIDKKLTESETN